jgi:Tfp pilus assembly protein PilF
MGKRWVLGARLSKARSLLSQEKWQQAREEFSSVSNDSSASTDQICSAWIGYASGQQGQKQWKQAADTIRQQILESRNKEIAAYTSARAHGWLIWARSTEEQAGGDASKLEWAMIRYLRAAVMASTGNGEVLAESLYRAKELAKKQGDSDRAESLNQRLKQVAPDSRWSNK